MKFWSNCFFNYYALTLFYLSNYYFYLINLWTVLSGPMLKPEPWSTIFVRFVIYNFKSCIIFFDFYYLSLAC